MTTLAPLEKVIVHGQNGPVNARVIGIRSLSNQTVNYYLEPLRLDFTPFKNGGRIMRVNSTEIDSNTVHIEKH